LTLLHFIRWAKSSIFMKRIATFLLLGITAAPLALGVAAAFQKPTPEPKPIELSGRFRRPVKWTPQLEIVPAGQVQRIDLEGDLLRDINEGTPLRVRGVVRTRLHLGGSEKNPSPFPAQWIVWLDVTEVEVLKDVFDVLKQ
jgi:hypothetical protein